VAALTSRWYPAARGQTQPGSERILVLGRRARRSRLRAPAARRAPPRPSRARCWHDGDRDPKSPAGVEQPPPARSGLPTMRRSATIPARLIATSSPSDTVAA
jgi:hypothetical protein